MTGSGIESDFVLPDSLSYRIIAHCQLSISILAQTVDFFAQLAYRRIHLRLFAPQTIPEALPLDSAKGSSTLWTPFRAIQLVTTAYSVRVFIEGTRCLEVLHLHRRRKHLRHVLPLRQHQHFNAVQAHQLRQRQLLRL